MKTKADKKRCIRNEIVSASQVYRDNFAGKLFLYTVGSDYFEVAFKTDSFMHLTGVNSNLTAKDFYKKAKCAKLSPNQIFFDQNHPFQGAKKKLPCLLQLPLLTNNLVCVVKNMFTVTITYNIGITNLDFTIGLVEDSNCVGDKKVYVPRTLRVKDNTVERSQSAEFADFIFSKNAVNEKYNTVNYADGNKIPPDSVKDLLSAELVQKYYNL